MNELNDRRQDMVLVALIAARPGREYHQSWPQPLSPAADDVFRDLPNQRHLGIQAAADNLVDVPEVGGNERA
jgi:hypothetical protein